MRTIERRRRALAALLALPLVACDPEQDAPGPAATPPPRPNLLLLTADDLDFHSLGLYQEQGPSLTPHLDALARAGLRFTQAHVTVPVCQPTRAVWMTGLLPTHNGALGFGPIRPEVPTLVEALRQEGYRTGLFAKQRHVVPTRAQAWHRIVTGEELGHGRDPDRYAEETARFLAEAAQADAPFFLMVNLRDPHRPFAGSEAERRTQNRPRYRDVAFPPPTRTVSPEEVRVPGWLPDLPAVRQEWAEYCSSVHRMDVCAGRVLAELERAGAAADTCVVFLSDHGASFPFSKGNLWRQATRTPLLVRWPGVVEADREDRTHLVSGVDLAPTLLAIAQAPALPASDGRSFLPLLRGEEDPGFTAAFTQMHETSAGRPYPMRAVDTARYTYIYNAWADGSERFQAEAVSTPTMAAMRRAAAGDPALAARVRLHDLRVREELYDHQEDPDGLRNLAAEDPPPAALGQLRARLAEQLTATGDPLAERFRREVGLD